jgi:hypothetical protein
MPITIQTKGPKNGRCNICGKVGSLTEDHTPPKGCYRPTQVELHSIFQRITIDTENTQKPRFSQNGVKFRTLCKRCNNTLLGSLYDPALIAFVNSISSVLNSSLALPTVLPVRGQPQAIIRSVIGHLCAQGVDRYEKGPLTESIREYLLDKSLPLPVGIRLFYWAYPFRSHVMVRDASCVIHFGVTQSFGTWFLKFFPVAFLLAWDGPDSLPFQTHSFDVWRYSSFDTIAEIPITLHPITPEVWPEYPLRDSMIMYGDEAINVKPHLPIIRAN